MKGIYIIGTGKFALEVVCYLEQSGLGLPLLGHVEIADGSDQPQPAQTSAIQHAVDREAGYVLGVSDPSVRARIIAEFVDANQLQLPNLVHRTALVAPSAQLGEGNIIGPHCYVGTNVQLGKLNVLNACCSVGHHSRIGDANFFAPDTHFGNSVEVGNHNHFGIGVRAIHELQIGGLNRVQAGTVLLESLESGDFVMANISLKRMRLYGRRQHG